MSLEVVASPESESDLAFALCALDAHGIPHFVHGGAFGALWPGPQITPWNGRRILVPAPLADEARQVLAQFGAAGIEAPTVAEEVRESPAARTRPWWARWFGGRASR
jgi:hypothetical protein